MDCCDSAEFKRRRIGRYRWTSRARCLPIPATGKDFVNYAYTGTLSDKGGTSLDRTKEGYVEIIEMASFPSFTTTSAWVTHVAGVPPGCADLIADGPGFAQVHSDIFPLTGGGDLFGGMTLINVNSGTDFTEDAVALSNFVHDDNVYNDPGVIKPDLRDADLISQVLYQAAGRCGYVDLATGGRRRQS